LGKTQGPKLTAKAVPDQPCAKGFENNSKKGGVGRRWGGKGGPSNKPTCLGKTNRKGWNEKGVAQKGNVGKKLL